MTHPLRIKFYICVLFSTYFLNGQEANINNLSTIEPDAFEVIRQFYDYDKIIPLESSIIDSVRKKDYVR
jgi:hypothetical protein